MSFQIVGILNVTPDSFFDGGRYNDAGQAFKKALALIEDGADMLDVGGESTRPGSNPVSLKEEKQRVVPLIKKLAKEVNVPISVDTYKAKVASAAIDAGASVVNDISGFTMDPNMASVVADGHVKAIIGHIQGTPINMQTKPTYGDVIEEIGAYFKRQLKVAYEAGISREQLILDPGIGFGKTLEHNLEILNRIDEFLKLECPVMLGASRKSFIGKIQKDSGPKDRMAGSIATAVLGLKKGVKYFRVHDVKETKQALAIAKQILNN